MNIPTLKSFFGWCTVIDVVFLVFASLIISFAGDAIYAIQSWFFSISREAFYTTCYSWLGLLKAIIIIFNFVPWISLMIIEKAEHV